MIMAISEQSYLRGVDEMMCSLSTVVVVFFRCSGNYSIVVVLVGKLQWIHLVVEVRWTHLKGTVSFLGP